MKEEEMKKVTLALLSMFTISSISYAESFPAYGDNSYKAQYDSNGSIVNNDLYVGLGYSYTNSNLNIPAIYLGTEYDFDIQSDNVFFVAGYDINKYFSIEARYSFSVTDLDFDLEGANIDEGLEWGGDISNFGLYVKPKYTSGDVTVYALLGYGHIRIDVDNIGDHSENEFQWGAGLSMDVGNSIINNSQAFLFLDYIRYYDDETSQIDLTIDAINVGIAFKF